MMGDERRDALRTHYAWARDSSDAELDVVLAAAAHAEIPAGTGVFSSGDHCSGFPLVLDGTIRVRKVAADGKEITLYRVGPGESCILTSSCLIGGADYTASAVAETPVTLLALPRAEFERLLARNAAFRTEVFRDFAQRLGEMMSLVDAVAFRRLDQRLADRLLGHGNELRLSHQQLAQELGSVREIISRLLGDFAARGCIRLGRGRIEVLDPAELRRIAAGR
ncbi:MAG: Crp/Fnr family transcriptional regulator [Steroidobacteraceae bacterium]